MRSAPAVAKLLAYLADLYPSLDVTPERIAAWSSVLGRFSEVQLREAATVVANTHRHGAPNPALFVEAIEGRLERRPIPVTDHWNRKILNADGSPRTEMVAVRVWPDGSWEEASDDRLPEREAAKRIDSGPHLIGDGIDGLLEGLAE